jgi:anaerobic selenocysteine-containing dehydrogenase
MGAATGQFDELILPVSTKSEQEEIDNDNRNGSFVKASCLRQTIEPLGEALSDFEVVGEVAKRFGLYEQFANGRTVDEMIEDGFNASGKGAFVTSLSASLSTDPAWVPGSPTNLNRKGEPCITESAA